MAIFVCMETLIGVILAAAAARGAKAGYRNRRDRDALS